MTPFTIWMVKQGYVPIGGDDIPVYLKFNPEDEHYPYTLAFDLCRDSGYDLLNEWHLEGKIIDEDKTFGSTLNTFCFNKIPQDMNLHKVLLMILSDYYWHNGDEPGRKDWHKSHKNSQYSKLFEATMDKFHSSKNVANV